MPKSELCSQTCSTSCLCNGKQPFGPCCQQIPSVLTEHKVKIAVSHVLQTRNNGIIDVHNHCFLIMLCFISMPVLMDLSCPLGYFGPWAYHSIHVYAYMQSGVSSLESTEQRFQKTNTS
jgi:hypothetical protein